MTRASLWLPRSERRRVDRLLRKLPVWETP
jgi:hypothetical protein